MRIGVVRWIRPAIAAALTLTCFGCSAKIKQAYPGPELQASEIATLTGSRHGLYLLFYNRVIFVGVDAVDDSAPEPGATWQLLPGEHTARTAYRMNRLFMLGGAFFAYGQKPRLQVLKLNARAGARYRVDGHVIETVPDVPEYCAWIEDEATHEVVSGTKDCHAGLSVESAAQDNHDPPQQ